MAKKVLVAMSGGVDSSTAAALLVKKQYDVIGVTMQVWPAEPSRQANFGGCCSLDAVEDARQVSYKLGIPHYVLNFRDIFAEKVISDFAREYLCGRTPNPCFRCNQHIKFEELLRKADVLGADFLATGHYARIEARTESGLSGSAVPSRYCLKKAVDDGKDQSYVLGSMPAKSLERVLFPLGEYPKDEVRRLAKEWGLPVANKPDSQEICFIPDDDYGFFLRTLCPDAVRPGPIKDSDGQVLGDHRGIAFYTVGQRRRLGLATGKRLYVQRLDAEQNTVIVGPESALYGDGLVASELNWLGVGVSGSGLRASAKIRYKTPGAAATLSPLGPEKMAVYFDQPQRAITPGQAVTFYQGDEVIGAGVIESKLERK